jgi:hypothetical protein
MENICLCLETLMWLSMDVFSFSCPLEWCCSCGGFVLDSAGYILFSPFRNFVGIHFSYLSLDNNSRLTDSKNPVHMISAAVKTSLIQKNMYILSLTFYVATR